MVEHFNFQKLIQQIYDAYHRSRCVCLSQKRQHQAGFHKVYGKQTFASDTAEYRVHLHNGSFRIVLQKLLEICITASNAASPVHLEFRLFVTGMVFDFPRKINVPDVKKPGINIVIQGLLTAHQLIYMIQVDLMKGLSVFDQRTDDSIGISSTRGARLGRAMLKLRGIIDGRVYDVKTAKLVSRWSDDRGGRRLLHRDKAREWMMRHADGI